MRVTITLVKRHHPLSPGVPSADVHNLGDFNVDIGSQGIDTVKPRLNICQDNRLPSTGGRAPGTER